VVLIQVLTFSSAVKNSNPFHSSWTDKQSRYDFIFSVSGPLKTKIELESVAENFSLNALSSCTGHSACLLKNGNFTQAFSLDSSKVHRLVYKLVDKNSTTNQTIPTNSTQPTTCKDNEAEVTVSNFCSTHWNPPTHLYANGCNHALEWHSPFSCNSKSTNYEHPCYLYDDLGKLIDLTPWVQSSGSSYEVDTSLFNKTVKKFNLNVCNEAHDACGPNVSACYVNEGGSVESGYNNLTTIDYDVKDKAVIVTSLGHHKESCPDHRLRTTLRFSCITKTTTSSKPRLTNLTACESIVEWQTIHACPVPEIGAPSTDCSIKYKPLDIDIDLRSLTKNASFVEVSNFKLEGKEKNMMLGICRGIDKNIMKCEGKSTSATTACLIDAGYNTTDRKANNSEIVGSITKSFIRLADNRLYLESFATNKSCQIPAGRNFNATRQVGTRIEFYCSDYDDDKPKFLGFEDCIYTFEWGTRLLCFETAGTIGFPKIQIGGVVTNLSTNIEPKKTTNLSDESLKIQLDQKQKSASEMHKATLDNSVTIIEPKKKTDEEVVKNIAVEKIQSERSRTPAQNVSIPKSVTVKTTSSETTQLPKKMDTIPKFFMISLIVMSLTAFILIIFILDKKTRLRIPIGNIRRQARQVFQPQPVPYSRVNEFNDSLDL